MTDSGSGMASSAPPGGPDTGRQPTPNTNRPLGPAPARPPPVFPNSPPLHESHVQKASPLARGATPEFPIPHAPDRFPPRPNRVGRNPTIASRSAATGSMPRITRPPPQARLEATREEDLIPVAGLRLTDGTNALACPNINRTGLIYHTHINRLISPALQSPQIINKTQTNRKNPCNHQASMRFSTRDGAKKYHAHRYADALIALFGRK